MSYLQRAIAKSRRLGNRKRKTILQVLANHDRSAQNRLIVVGCQRSGTSMMYKTFERDPNAAVYDEVSVISNKDKLEGLRLNSMEFVLNEFNRSPASLVIAKPLVESQRTSSLLDDIPRSKAIWMFRNYTDVASSNLKRFGNDNGLSDILPIWENDQTNWRCEGLSDKVRELICSFRNSNLRQSDAAALFWYARNSLYFQQNLEADPRVYICQYEYLVQQPKEVIRDMYNFIGVPYPTDKVLQGISARSIGKGADIDLSPKIRELCDQMLNKLESAAKSRQV